MFFSRSQKFLDLNGLVSLMKRDITNRRLTTVLAAIHKHRTYCRAFQGEAADGVFREILQLSGCTNELIEQQLLRLNLPPKCGIPVSTEQTLWVLVSSLIFKLNSDLSESFSETLIKRCLTESTDLAFALLHSDAIASITEHHNNLINTSFVDIVISSTDDSRSIYGLKVARWLPDWPMLKDTAFEALLSENPVKRDAAQFLLNLRASCAEALSFAQDQGISLPQVIARSNETRQITNAIVKGKFGRSSFAVKHNTGLLSEMDLRRLSARIKRVLGHKRFNREHRN